MSWEVMEQILQLRRNERSTNNTRSFRGLQHVLNRDGDQVPTRPHTHQLYDLLWRRLQVDLYGGAINADDPDFGKVNLPSPFEVSDSIIQFECPILTR